METPAGSDDDQPQVTHTTKLPSPSRDFKYQKAFESATEISLSEEAAFSFLVEYDLTKSQYQGLRSLNKDINSKLYPPYKKLLQAKNCCYPPHLAITVTESSVAVQLQALLDHTVERILLLQSSLIRSLPQENVSNMVLVCKWGCDESSGQSEYQTFTDGIKSDVNVFSISIVPLQLTSIGQETKAQTVVWKNPRPSSHRFCRPLRLQFLHEDSESTVNEVQDIEEQIRSLVSFETVIDGKEISIVYDMVFTLVDDEVCNAMISMKSPQHCYLCGATSKDFNDIDDILQRKVDVSNSKFGLSTSHMWIRFFECCLHLSYKLGIKEWQARSAEDKKITEDRQRIIQKGFTSKLGLTVDRAKPGYGNINDQNTARCFFENSTLSASITGLDECLIKRFNVILQVISSGYNINYDKFQEYAVETARKFVKLYPWYYMPTSVHKLLIHGPHIIAHALLPIGQLSKDVQTAGNKDIKRYRENFSYKSSRAKTMMDVFNRLMVTSDPYISGIRKLPHKNLKSLSRAAVELLLHTAVPVTTGTESSPTNATDSEVESDLDVDSDSDIN